MSSTPGRVIKKNRWFYKWKVLFAILMASFLPQEVHAHKAAPPPDIETASDKYKLRFASKTGKWFLDEQISGLLSMLDRWETASILDVGGGHGQYTEQLVKRGYSVNILGSSIEANTQVLDLITSDCCRYIVGDFSRFPFPDKSFDIVISFRLMTHLDNWESFIAESSRVAKHAVVIDFPVLHSLNVTYPLLFKLKRKLEGNSTRPFNVFDEKKVLESFRDAGFSPTSRYAQYFFPMVFHRVLNSSKISKGIEKICRSLTLTDHYGSPVILRAEPKLDVQKKFSNKA
ncbi:MAG: class I SAM-dependent methyltransferase [Desulfobulbaceae bacterium]|nr:class I SAM-dependent methyltransferase [Desulfobulbaceae bacterium]